MWFCLCYQWLLRNFVPLPVVCTYFLIFPLSHTGFLVFKKNNSFIYSTFWPLPPLSTLTSHLCAPQSIHPQFLLTKGVNHVSVRLSIYPYIKTEGVWGIGSQEPAKVPGIDAAPISGVLQEDQVMKLSHIWRGPKLVLFRLPGYWFRLCEFLLVRLVVPMGFSVMHLTFVAPTIPTPHNMIPLHRHNV